jgi:hypothetical protein
MRSKAPGVTAPFDEATSNGYRQAGALMLRLVSA